MPSQRRLSNEDLSLEQRLVTQLSAALRQEDLNDQQIATIRASFSNRERPTLESLTGQSDSANIDLSALLGSLGSALSSQHEAAPPSSAPAAPAGEPTAGADDHTQASETAGSAAHPVSDQLVALLQERLHPASHEGDGLREGGVAGSAANTPDQPSSLLTGIEHSSPAAQLPRPPVQHQQQQQPLPQGKEQPQQHQQRDQLYQFRQQLAGNSAEQARAPNLPQTAGERELSELSSAKDSMHSFSRDASDFRLTPHSIPHISPEFRATSIDPEVSSIQSVLQMLLTNGSNVAQDSGSTGVSEPVQAAGSASSISTDLGGASLAHSVSGDRDPAAAGTATSYDSAGDISSLLGYELGAEDQGLIDSLRSAISQAASGTSAAGTPSVPPPASATTFGSTGLADSSGRVQKAKSASSRPKAKPRAGTKYSATTLRNEPTAALASTSASSSSDHSDFNASDPDTLRAIQQALLSSMGPSAAATSLAESLTQPQRTSADSSTLASATDLSVASQRLTGEASHEAAANALMRLPPSSAQVAGPTMGSLAKPDTHMAGKPASKYATAKGAKPAEIDKQKLREDNAARKRKWRELNHLQNRDRDLRLRIVKRSHELFGESDTAEKSKWIEQEFSRRRNRRILRAGIHSIVESARARAQKAQESGSSNAAFDRPPLATSGTLTQQSRQVASTQLSQLFKNSNAALEPQLHNEKLSLPLTPYMLVASPKRPPYRRSLPTASHIASESRAKQLTSKESASPKDQDDTASLQAQPDGTEGPGSNSKPGTELQAPEPPLSGARDSAKDEQGSSSPDDASNANRDRANASLPATETPAKPASEQPPPSRSQISEKPDDADKGPSNSKEDGANNTNKSESPAESPAESITLYPSRSKHRYALIGKVALGIPPNLAAIYHKIRGRAPVYAKRLTPKAPTTQVASSKDVAEGGSAVKDRPDPKTTEERSITEQTSGGERRTEERPTEERRTEERPTEAATSSVSPPT